MLDTHHFRIAKFKYLLTKFMMLVGNQRVFPLDNQPSGIFGSEIVQRLMFNNKHNFRKSRYTYIIMDIEGLPRLSPWKYLKLFESREPKIRRTLSGRLKRAKVASLL